MSSWFQHTSMLSKHAWISEQVVLVLQMPDRSVWLNPLREKLFNLSFLSAVLSLLVSADRNRKADSERVSFIRCRSYYACVHATAAASSRWMSGAGMLSSHWPCSWSSLIYRWLKLIIIRVQSCFCVCAILGNKIVPGCSLNMTKPPFGNILEWLSVCWSFPAAELLYERKSLLKQLMWSQLD